jgi:K+-sensing histidine kinase KdpD
LAEDKQEQVDLQKSAQPPKDEIQELFQNTPWLFALVSALGHELRTPLSGIVGLNELLLLSDLNEQQKDFLQATRVSTNGLLATLNDVVDIARIDANKLSLQPSPIDAAYVLKETVRGLAAPAKERDVEFEIEYSAAMPREIKIDGNRVKQTLLVLVNNYMYVARSVKVKLDCHLEGLGVRFYCRLPIIAAHDLRKQFEPFLKTNDHVPDKQIPTWLRLRLANRIVKAMGGEIHEPEIDGDMFNLSFSVPLT